MQKVRGLVLISGWTFLGVSERALCASELQTFQFHSKEGDGESNKLRLKIQAQIHVRIVLCSKI
jgi:hypothetical protein